jgi:hypothetical protein
MCGIERAQHVLVKVADGASSAPLAVDRMADSSAPKNMICAHSGILPMTRSGRMRWMSRASSAEQGHASGSAISVA